MHHDILGVDILGGHQGQGGGNEHCTSMMDIETGPEEPTSHELASKGSVAGWDKVRQGMLKAVTEGAGLPFVRVHMLQCIYILQCTYYAYSGMPEDLKCTVCANLASMRCHRVDLFLSGVFSSISC